MRLPTAAILATVLAFTQAAPVEPTATVEQTVDVEQAMPGQSPNPSTSEASPLVSDCQQITRNIANGGRWEVEDFGGQHQLVQYGTCAFGVTGDKSINGFYVGNSDIIDLINDSISRYQWHGKVGSKGVMGCHSLLGAMSGARVTWGLYHNLPQDQFHVVKGTAKEHHETHESGMHLTLRFCGTCGCPLYKTADRQEVEGGVIILAGTLDDPRALDDAKPEAEFFVKDRASWWPALADAKQLPEFT
ncbi:uncharacterized protein CDV56_107558 [Aspergillus thermomutatus]|uniref:CENP-V/GFA domain-containing protein n=1 Tax=Aspergillus thermomutatus TaxID=41047 RepID=A0A397GW05_ASPTH|nr:uncharacterized protein CDV56_107558 [Aspergillus thermomutatus]RHZ53848.1 hypothetical protein CDV56_107558 [Aspergillus thermomutatus]